MFDVGQKKVKRKKAFKRLEVKKALIIFATRGYTPGFSPFPAHNYLLPVRLKLASHPRAPHPSITYAGTKCAEKVHVPLREAHPPVPRFTLVASASLSMPRAATDFN